MSPGQLEARSFVAYPPEARSLATRHLELLRGLPLAFLPLLLRELIAYDWRFPAERRELDAQLELLSSAHGGELRKRIAAFEDLRLGAGLERLDWVNSPGEFAEQLTAHLWATHQVDAFRAAAVSYMYRVRQATPQAPPPAARLGIVVIGHGAGESRYALFRRLRRHGMLFRNVDPERGWETLRATVAARAAAHPVPYGHWHIDGVDGSESPAGPGVAYVSWSSLARTRTALLDRIHRAISSGMGPEAVRTMLAQLRPADLGSGAADDGVLRRFEISLLTEGSGTQIYSTTFVQWAARESLRRAQPVTLVARFGPRVREQSLGELLSNPHQPQSPDPQGSLIDAEQGAYYTWINQQRLPGAEQSRFLVWFENHGEALAIAPSLRPGTESAERIGIEELIGRVA